MKLFKGKEKEKSEKQAQSREERLESARSSLLFMFPFLRRGEDGDGAGFQVKSGAEKHGRFSAAEQATFLVAALTVTDCALLFIRYVTAFMGLEKTVVTRNPLLIILAAAIPFIAWIRATDEKFFAYHKRKRVFFALAWFHATLIVFQLVYSLCWTALVPLIVGKVTITAAMTRKAVVLLVYLSEGIMLTVAAVLLYRMMEPLIKSEPTWRSIEIFKLQHFRDSRKNAENRYDVTAITSLEDGKPIRIKENDRYVQTEINGASGTGKTSSIFLNVIRGDLDVKFKNREIRHDLLLKMITEGRAVLRGPLTEFDESAVTATGKTKAELKKNEKELARIREDYPDCGITVVAPNPDLNENIIRMCAARHFNVNVIDPVSVYSSHDNVREMAINPFYLPPGLETRDFDRDNELVIRISQASSAFADVLIATNQMGGSSDVYFTDISLSVSSNVAAVVMLAKYVMKGGPFPAYIDDIHECITNFDNLTQYVQIIESTYNIIVEVNDPKKQGDFSQLSAGGVNKMELDKMQEAKERARKNPYYQQLLFVKQELLGPGREAMFSQSRGLRNLITKILQDPRIKRKLSAEEDRRVDFDKILAKNEITLVSTAVELGQSISTSFGIFFLLLHRASVLRRPKATRSPHFLWVDECAQYVHPLFDDVIALYRQYRVAAVLTLQTLTQLEKHRETAYLKNVFLGAGTHVVFGRLAVEEMELYSKMAGITREKQAQVSETSNSFLASNPTLTESVRYTPTMTNVMEGSDMRLLDFQELTIFTIDGGRVLPGQHARVFFLPEDAYDEKTVREIDWKRIAPEAFRERTEEEEELEKRRKEAREKKYEPAADEIHPEDEVSFIIENTDKKDAIEDGKKDDGDLERLVDEAGDLNEIYAKLQSGEW